MEFRKKRVEEERGNYEGKEEKDAMTLRAQEEQQNEKQRQFGEEEEEEKKNEDVDLRERQQQQILNRSSPNHFIVADDDSLPPLFPPIHSGFAKKPNRKSIEQCQQTLQVLLTVHYVPRLRSTPPQLIMMLPVELIRKLKQTLQPMEIVSVNIHELLNRFFVLPYPIFLSYCWIDSDDVPVLPLGWGFLPVNGLSRFLKFFVNHHQLWLGSQEEKNNKRNKTESKKARQRQPKTGHFDQWQFKQNQRNNRPCRPSLAYSSFS